MTTIHFPPSAQLRNGDGVPRAKFLLGLLLMLGFLAGLGLWASTLTRGLLVDSQIKKPLLYPAADLDDKLSSCSSQFLFFSSCHIVIHSPRGDVEKTIVFLNDYKDYQTAPVYDADHPERISDSLSQEKIYQRGGVVLALWGFLGCYCYFIGWACRRRQRLARLVRHLNEHRDHWQLGWQPLPNPDGDAQKFALELDGEPLELHQSLRQQRPLGRDGRVLTLGTDPDCYVVLNQELSHFGGSLDDYERVELRSALENWMDENPDA